MGTLEAFWTGDGFMPHGHCYLWTPAVLWLHVGSDMLIALSYYSIPAALLVFLRRRRDVAFPAVFALFIAFIFACGTTHLLEVWTTWHPQYGLEGLAKAATAGVSLLTAVVMWPLLPRAVALPSPAQLARANAELEREVAQRREAERRLREATVDQAARLAAIVDSSDDAILSMGLDGTIQSWNEGATRLYGYAAQEMVGQHVSRLFAQGDDPECPQGLDQLKAGAPSVHVEVVRKRVDGSTLEVSLTLSPLRDAEGRIVGASSSGRDISERQRARARLEAMNEQLTRRGEEIERLLYAVSHDLKSPLVTVNGFAAVAQEAAREGRHEEAVVALDRVERAGGRAAALIGYLSELSQASRNLEPAWVDTREVLSELAEQLTVQLAEHGARLAFDSDLPRVYVDRTSLVRIADNLIGNALKYGVTSEQPTVEVRGERTQTGATLCFVDHGPGIAPEARKRAFQPYARLSRTTEGTGLGLAIVARLVQAHGGEVWVEDTPGGGATLCLWLPDAQGAPLQGRSFTSPQ